VAAFQDKTPSIAPSRVTEPCWLGCWVHAQDVKLSKLIMLGLAFGCAADAVVMAAGLSSQVVHTGGNR
jgi:hypothetical protein